MLAVESPWSESMANDVTGHPPLEPGCDQRSVAERSVAERRVGAETCDGFTQDLIYKALEGVSPL